MLSCPCSSGFEVVSQGIAGTYSGLFLHLVRERGPHDVEEHRSERNLALVPALYSGNKAVVDGVHAIESACDLTANGSRGVRVSKKVDAPGHGGHEGCGVVETMKRNRQSVHAVGPEIVGLHGVAIVVLSSRGDRL